MARHAVVRWGLVATFAFLVLGTAATMARGESRTPDFRWSVPARMGVKTDERGLLEYSTEPDKVRRGPWRVDFEVLPGACDHGASDRWSVDGKVVATLPTTCHFSYDFDQEGIYHVALAIDGPRGKRSSDTSVTVTDWLIVSLGDSVASGEGNPDRPRKRGALWADSRCHRSSLAGPAQAALALERDDQTTSVTFVHLACSGATIGSGLLHGYKGIDRRRRKPKLLPSQISELRRVEERRPIDAVLLNIGANDVHFGPVSTFCVLYPRCFDLPFDPKHAWLPPLPGRRRLTVVVNDALARLPDEYAELDTALNSVFRSRQRPPIFIVEYFDPTSQPGGGYCRILGISRTEAKWAHDNLLGPLNLAVAAAAQARRWILVPGVAEDFRGHGWCADGPARWIRRAGGSLKLHGLSKPGAALAGTLHPNERGHLAIAALITGVLARGLHPPPSERHDEDGHLERWAAVGLGGGAVLYSAGVAGAAVRRRRRGPEADDAPRGASEGVGPPPVGPPSEELVRAGVAVLELASKSHDWVHRRVESIGFQDDGTVRRRVSVDFTAPHPPTAPPGGRVLTHVPLALLPKGPLVNFDLRDASGTALPLMTRGEGTGLLVSGLLELATTAAGGRTEPQLRELVWTTVVGSVRDAKDALERLESDSSPAIQAAWNEASFRGWVETLAEMFVVLVPLEEDGIRRVLKYAYDEPVLTVRERLKRGRVRAYLASRLGWRPLESWFELRNLADTASCHVEVAGGRELEAAGVILGVDAAGSPIHGSRHPSFAPRAHLHIDAAPPGSVGLARIWLRVRRAGLLRGAPPIAALAASILTAAWFGLPNIASQSRNVVPLFLIVPSVLAAYLGRPGEHPVASELLLPTRMLLVISGFLSFGAAATIAAGMSVAGLRWTIGIAAVLAWGIAGLLRECSRRPRTTVTS